MVIYFHNFLGACSVPLANSEFQGRTVSSVPVNNIRFNKLEVFSIFYENILKLFIKTSYNLILYR